ncbi:extracellular solute-binding protein [Desulfovibrio sp. OttesenSCG-928-I05]|nr:extracellular solute-binding protein [Desulfovibrio sp. OttesenSCG-928-I05]
MKGMLKAFSILALVSCFALPLHAGAADKTVVVYTPLKSAAVSELMSRFTKETGIKVETVQANTGTILRRVKAESGNARADVMVSLGGADLQGAAELIEPYTSKNDDKLAEAFRVGAHWIPFSAATAVVVINTEEVKEADRPASWKDLADPRWKGKIASTRADQSGNAFQTLATVLNSQSDEEAAWVVYKGLMNNLIFVESAGEVARVVNDGELPLGFTLEDNALDYVKGGGPIVIMYPAEGTSIIPDGMALVKNAPHPEEGKALIDWLLTETAQRYIVDGIGRRSVLAAIPEASEGAQPFDKVARVKYDFVEIGEKSAGWIERWKQLRSERDD